MVYDSSEYNLSSFKNREVENEKVNFVVAKERWVFYIYFLTVIDK
jgi:hypothetical protein